METKSQAPSEYKKYFLLKGRHSRNSSLSSLVGDEAEDSVELLPSLEHSQSKLSKETGSYNKGGDESTKDCKISAACMCKLSVVFYLVACIIISALYVVFFGKNQAFFGDAWIPGKPTIHDKPPSEPQPYFFQDLPYTEWISQRWTYQDAPFADWPTLPDDIDDIQQLVAGKLGGSSGLWLLTDSQLFFVRGLHGGSPEAVEFLNVSQQLDLDVTVDSYVASKFDSYLYLISSYNITYLDCSLQECKVSSASCDLLPFDTVLTSCYSLSDNTLWLGTTEGLFTVTLQDECLTFSNVSQVTIPVQTLAWRSVVSSGDKSRHPSLQPFFLQPSAKNSLQEVFASSGRHGTQSTGSYWTHRKVEHGFGVLVVGTRDKLYFYDGSQWWFEWISVWETGLGGLVDGVSTAMTFGPSGELYIGNNVSLTRVNINYTFDRIGPLEGLPYNHVTSLHVSSYSPSNPPPMGPATPPSLVGTLWIGTAKGYTLFDIQRSKFLGYFNGPRWLPGGALLSITRSSSAVVVLTQQGLAVVHPEMWTLAMKARHYQAMLQRHTREPGLVSDCPVANYTPSTCSPASTDNDGLWTSWLVAAEAFRYSVTKDYGARENSWALFSGLKFLVNVTDMDGLMARTVVSENSSTDVSGEDWHESTSIPGWRWKGDTSSDEVVGHMWAYPLVHDLVARDKQERQQVQDVLEEVVDYIKSNQYVLMDVGNHSTRWGVWSPSQLNLNQSWADERGLNSLQMLSYLLSAYRITKNQDFLQAWKELFSGLYEDVPTHYGLNMVNQKITFPLDDNFSDDELAFLPYFLYFYSLKSMDMHQLEEVGTEAQQFAELSVERTWRTVAKGKSSAWTALYAYITGATHRKYLLEQLVWNLRTWPLELIQWSSHNSHRLDIRINPEQDRNSGSGTQSVEVLPANERTQLRWNGNPFLLDREGSSNEMDPGPWLLPYWMARWTGML